MAIILLYQPTVYEQVLQNKRENEMLKLGREHSKDKQQVAFDL